MQALTAVFVDHVAVQVWKLLPWLKADSAQVNTTLLNASRSELPIDVSNMSIDFEFTGLSTNCTNGPSLFDTGEERFRKLKKSVTQFSVPQLGLSAFVPDPDSINKKQQSVDYIYEGVSFLNNEQEVLLKQHLKEFDHMKGLNRTIDEKNLQDICSKVASWSVKAKEDLTDVLLLTELKQRFKNIWTSEKHGENWSSVIRILRHMLGFTEVFRILTNSNKPIVGHNNFTDLLFMYDKFYKPLPDKYSTYKSDICALFPQVFDTKHIAFRMRNLLEQMGLPTETSLGKLFSTLSRTDPICHKLSGLKNVELMSEIVFEEIGILEQSGVRTMK
ncbi:hypothetical protein LSH36_44g17023 [Paralvinella palmiformis]|uniref:Uncharacterized protein n=1 Tax=Paralvinella palmiformis TaxID=53620 RepID=A0AAD9K756_9ANNE|nr:hypothetical protein LSH36_44g17023 [Paralvinella palmiformis]